MQGKYLRYLLFFCLIAGARCNLIAQQEVFKCMFYNAENLFDIQDDSLTADDDFLPGGVYYWTYNRMQQKITNIYKVIVAAGAGEMPAIIGLCEIENRYVLNQLVFETPLLKYNYKIVHYDSPDVRGIDVALIYRPDKFTVIDSKPIRVIHPEINNYRTRDILYVKGIIDNTDTLHVCVNHWPSRRGGQVSSASKRMAAANALKSISDSVLSAQHDACLIAMGDFNDNPGDASMQVMSSGAPELQLINAANDVCSRFSTGTLKYQGEWSCFDQFLISRAIESEHGIRLSPEGYTIFSPDFLSVPDERFSGVRPFRTYLGRQYKGGYSDHYPVLLELILP